MIHPSAIVEPGVVVGQNTKVWHNAHIRAGAVIGNWCVIGKDAYIDAGVQIGSRCKIQNGAKIYAPARLENGVFVGPGASVINDLKPRAINRDGSLKKEGDWQKEGSLICEGASLGAHSVVLPGIKVGAWAMIAVGSVVTKEVPSQALMIGVPAKLRGKVCICGQTIKPPLAPSMNCSACLEHPGWEAK